MRARIRRVDFHPKSDRAPWFIPEVKGWFGWRPLNKAYSHFYSEEQAEISLYDTLAPKRATTVLELEIS